MKTAEIVKIKIEKLDDDLSGVAFRGGKKYVVAKTLPDEEVLCEVKRKSGNAVICDVKEILEKAGKGLNRVANISINAAAATFCTRRTENSWK